MFMVLSSWQSYCESSLGSSNECRMAPSGRRPKTKPDDLGYEFACIGCQSLHPPLQFGTNATYLHCEQWNVTIWQCSGHDNISVSSMTQVHNIWLSQQPACQLYSQATRRLQQAQIQLLLLLLICVSFTIIGQPRNSVLIRRV